MFLFLILLAVCRVSSTQYDSCNGNLPNNLNVMAGIKAAYNVTDAEDGDYFWVSLKTTLYGNIPVSGTLYQFNGTFGQTSCVRNERRGQENYENLECTYEGGPRALYQFELYSCPWNHHFYIEQVEKIRDLSADEQI